MLSLLSKETNRTTSHGTKRRRKGVAMHNFSTSHFSVPCINDATETLIGLRLHISLGCASRGFIFHFFLNNGEHLFNTQP